MCFFCFRKQAHAYTTRVSIHKTHKPMHDVQTSKQTQKQKQNKQKKQTKKMKIWQTVQEICSNAIIIESNPKEFNDFSRKKEFKKDLKSIELKYKLQPGIALSHQKGIIGFMHNDSKIRNKIQTEIQQIIQKQVKSDFKGMKFVFFFKNKITVLL